MAEALAKSRVDDLSARVFSTLKKTWGSKVCSLVPLDVWHRLLDAQLVLPYYHMVSDSDVEHVSGLYSYRNVRQFKADLEFFLRSYCPVGLDDVVACLDGRGRLPKRCFLLTFDDGFRENHDIVAPILNAQGVPAVFFLISSTIDNRELCYPQKKSLLVRAASTFENSPAKLAAAEILTRAGANGPHLASAIRATTYRQRHVLDELAPVLGCDFAAYIASTQPYLTSVQIRDLLRRGHSIGAHSVDHPLYTELDLDEQLMQTREGVRWLSERFSCEHRAFAFPYRDAGVTLEFFERAFSGGQLQVSFGTGGMCRHFFSRNLPRFSMERTALPAAQILAREFAKAVLYRS